MPIIDAQVHLWRKGTPSSFHRPTPYLVEEALRDMDAAGVDGAILHPPTSWDADSNEQAVEAVQAYPRRFAILGYPPLDRPDSRALVASFKQRPGMLGLRLYFNQPHNRCWPTDGTLDWLWPLAEERQLPLALLAGDWLPTLGEHSQRRRQTDRRPVLCRRRLSVQIAARALSRHVRRLRSAPAVLGHRHHQDAVLVARVRHPFSGDRMDSRRRQEAHHGRGDLRWARLEAIEHDAEKWEPVFRHIMLQR